MSGASMTRGLPAAVIFLTRLPVAGTYSDEDFGNASAFFPLVGFGVGLATAIVFLATQTWGDAVAACVAVAASVLLTGAMHEDGLADSADALFGGTTRERVLAIAKDPRLGSFGATALFLVLATRLACVATHPGRAFGGFVLTHVISRAAATATMAWLPYVRDEHDSKSAPVVRTTREHLVVAGCTAFGVLGLAVGLRAVSPTTALCVVAVSAAITVGLGLYVRKRVGGFVGDFLGAVIQLVDVSIWLTLAAVNR